MAYTYDLAGNKLSEKNAKGDTVSYAYDRLNRLKTVTDAYDWVVSGRVYDANGNVTKETDAEGTAPAVTIRQGTAPYIPMTWQDG